VSVLKFITAGKIRTDCGSSYQ